MARIAAMNAFVRVVEQAPSPRPRTRLDLPNATVTRLLQGLEEDLKVRLLHRTARSVTVTPEGETYYQRVVRQLADLTDIESSTRLSQGKPSGKWRWPRRSGDGHRARHGGFSSPVSRRRSGTQHRQPACRCRGGRRRLRHTGRRGQRASGGGPAHWRVRVRHLCDAGLLEMHGAPMTLKELRERPTVWMISARRPARWRFASSTRNPKPSWRSITSSS